MRESAKTTGTGGISPAFPAQWFYGLLRALLGEPACLPPSSARSLKHRRQLGACMGAPGPHDFAVRENCRSSVSTLASTATRLAFRDDRDTPLCNRGGIHRQYAKSEILKSRIFLTQGLDRNSRKRPRRCIPPNKLPRNHRRPLLRAPNKNDGGPVLSFLPDGLGQRITCTPKPQSWAHLDKCRASAPRARIGLRPVAHSRPEHTAPFALRAGPSFANGGRFGRHRQRSASS